MAGGEVYYGLSELVKASAPEARLGQLLAMLGGQPRMVNQESKHHLFRLPFQPLGAQPGRHAPHLDRARTALLGYKGTAAGRWPLESSRQAPVDLAAVTFVNGPLGDLPDALLQPLPEAGPPFWRVGRRYRQLLV